MSAGGYQDQEKAIKLQRQNEEKRKEDNRIIAYERKQVRLRMSIEMIKSITDIMNGEKDWKSASKPKLDAVAELFLDDKRGETKSKTLSDKKKTILFLENLISEANGLINFVNKIMSKIKVINKVENDMDAMNNMDFDRNNDIDDSIVNDTEINTADNEGCKEHRSRENRDGSQDNSINMRIQGK